MNKETNKREKGITLVALIITIVVLLILAVVAIGGAKDSSIIGHAQNAAKSYNQAKNNEVDTITKYENEIKKYASVENEIKQDDSEEKEYLEGTDIRINVKYYMWGKSESEISFTVYDNGEAILTDKETTNKMTYVVEEGKIKVIEQPGIEITVIKEEGNDILYVQPEEQLFATSTNGLKFFNGEKYQFDNDGYMESIRLEADGSEVWSKGYGGCGSGDIPVFYRGKVYGTCMYDADGNEYEITSTDNCETLLAKGNVYTKVQE